VEADGRTRWFDGVSGASDLWYVVHPDHPTRFLGFPEADSADDVGGEGSRDDAGDETNCSNWLPLWAASDCFFDRGDSRGGVGGLIVPFSNAGCACGPSVKGSSPSEIMANERVAD
jgi:hypothetical protein